MHAITDAFLLAWETERFNLEVWLCAWKLSQLREEFVIQAMQTISRNLGWWKEIVWEGLGLLPKPQGKEGWNIVLHNSSLLLCSKGKVVTGVPLSPMKTCWGIFPDDLSAYAVVLSSVLNKHH